MVIQSGCPIAHSTSATSVHCFNSPTVLSPSSPCKSRRHSVKHLELLKYLNFVRSTLGWTMEPGDTWTPRCLPPLPLSPSAGDRRVRSAPPWFMLTGRRARAKLHRRPTVSGRSSASAQHQLSISGRPATMFCPHPGRISCDECGALGRRNYGDGRGRPRRVSLACGGPVCFTDGCGGASGRRGLVTVRSGGIRDQRGVARVGSADEATLYTLVCNWYENRDRYLRDIHKMVLRLELDVCAIYLGLSG